MQDDRVSRRAWIRGAAGVAAAAGIAPRTARAAEAARGGGKALRLGAPVSAKSHDPEQLALAHRTLGYRAAYCPSVSLNDADRIRDVSAAFAKHDVVIAEVGRWCNLLDPDSAKRKANVARVTEGLALAEAIGARCCVDIAGSYNEKIWYGPHPMNVSKQFFDASVENARNIIDAVKPKRTKLCFEMMGWALPDGPDEYARMIRAVDRPAFGVHLDPCNLVNSPRRYYGSSDLIRECFETLGRWIVSCHAKDLAWDVEMNVHFREVTVGTGSIDYKVYLGCLAKLPSDVPLMIEHHASAEEYDKARRHILTVGKQMGLSFG